MPIQSALVIGSQECRSATNDGVSWDQERLSAREEGESYDVADGQDDEQERGGEALGSFDHGFLDRQGDLVTSAVDTDIEKGSGYCELRFREYAPCSFSRTHKAAQPWVSDPSAKGIRVTTVDKRPRHVELSPVATPSVDS